MIWQNSIFAMGGYGGIAYHHVSDMYILLFSHFIACGVWEAIYILDGLIRDKSDIKPTTAHADTQGQNLPVFGLASLLGVELMPRIRNWKDLTFYRPTSTTHYSILSLSFVKLREIIHRSTNKTEQYNNFEDWIMFASGMPSWIERLREWRSGEVHGRDCQLCHAR